MQVLAALAALVATAVAGVGQQVPWDPRRVDELPRADASVAPLLPVLVAVPDRAPALADRPLPAAVLTVQHDDALHLLGTDGSWRQVRPPTPGDTASLTRDGTRLAVERGRGVDVWDLPTGALTRVRAPSGHRAWDHSEWRWVDGDSLLLDDLQGGWRVDTITGVADRVLFPTGMSFGWTVDDAGAVVEVADPAAAGVLTDWGGDVRRRLDMTPTGRLSSVQVEGDTVVGTSFEHGGFAVHMADRLDLAPRAAQRVRDVDATYSSWALRVVGIRDDGSVLLWVAVPGRSAVDGWRIVRWAPATGRLEVVTASEQDPTRRLAFAQDLLG